MAEKAVQDRLVLGGIRPPHVYLGPRRVLGHDGVQSHAADPRLGAHPFRGAIGLCSWSASRDEPRCLLACLVLRSVAAGSGRRGLPPGTWCWSGRWQGTRILYRRSWGWVGGIRVGGRRSRIAGCSDVRSCRCLTRATGEFAPQALNAAWSLEPPAPPPGNPDGGVPPALPAGGAAPLPVGGVPAPGAPPDGAPPPAGRLTPCLRRQATSAARFPVLVALADAEDEVLLPELLPQALTRAASAITVSGISPLRMFRCLLVNVNSWRSMVGSLISRFRSRTAS